MQPHSQEWFVKQVIALVLAGASLSAPAAAQSSFDGTWALDPASTHVFRTRYDITLANGTFACNWCRPAWRIPADGRFHPVAGQRGYDEASVQIIDGQSAVFRRKRGGREVYAATDMISASGRHLAFSWVERDGETVVETGSGLWVRRGHRTAAAHPVTGQWRELWTKANTTRTGQITMTLDGTRLHMQLTPDQHFTATLGGPAARIEGDKRGTMVSVRRRGPQSLVQTERVSGRIVSVTRSTLRDPLTMDIVVEDHASNSLSRYTAQKQ
jgi:hypothetical protein